MQKPPHKFAVRDRVRIKDSVTGIYPMARAFMEGTIKGLRYDDLGFPLVFIEWDRDHWAYSGEADGWTLEDHFEKVELKMAQDKDLEKLLGALGDLVANFQKEETEPDDDPDGDYSDVDLEAPRPSFEDTLKAGHKAASESQAFAILVVRKAEIAGQEVLVPDMFFADQDDDLARLMLEAQLSDVGAQLHLQLMYDVVKKRGKRS